MTHKNAIHNAACATLLMAACFAPMKAFAGRMTQAAPSRIAGPRTLSIAPSAPIPMEPARIGTLSQAANVTQVLLENPSLNTITSVDPSVQEADRGAALNHVFEASARTHAAASEGVLAQAGTSSSPRLERSSRSSLMGVVAPIPVLAVLAGGAPAASGVAMAALAGGVIGAAVIGLVGYIRAERRHPGNSWNGLAALKWALGGAAAGLLVGGAAGWLALPALVGVAANGAVQVLAVSAGVGAATSALSYWRNNRKHPGNDWNRFFALRAGAIAFVASGLLGVLLAVVR